MPVDEATQVSKGFAFIEFSTPQARPLTACLREVVLSGGPTPASQPGGTLVLASKRAAPVILPHTS